MKYKTEVADIKQKVVIVGKNEKEVVNTLKEKFEKYEAEVYISPEMPKNLHIFNYCFLVNQDKIIDKLSKLDYKKIILIFIDREKKSREIEHQIKERHLNNIKIININAYFLNDSQLERIIWFSMTQTDEIFLNLSIGGLIPQKKVEKKPLKSLKHNRSFKKKNLIILFILLIIMAEFLFIPVLTFSTYFLYKSTISLKQGNIKETQKNLSIGEASFVLSDKLYKLSRPIFAFFSLAIYPDNLMDIDKNLVLLDKKTINLYEYGHEITRLIMKKNKTQAEIETIKKDLTKLKQDSVVLLDYLTTINQKLPDNITKLSLLKKELAQNIEMLVKMKKVFMNIDTILGSDGKKSYLLIFANNMELRPGGGFIGSYGILDLNEYTLEDLRIYDVYDADGQLKEHIDPPLAIRNYLNQPNWFLRDSAFSPDFTENYKKAKFFLTREMGIGNFSGGIMITTTAIQNILEAYDDVYLTDYNEVVNSKNYYLKTQFYAEKDFFPGSIQKKDFLGSLTRHLLIKSEEVSPIVLVGKIKKSLDEKQIVLQFENSDLQKLVQSFSWGGQVLESKCPNNLNNCIADYIYPYDANLGVNKANFFVNKSYTFKVKINESGQVTSNLSIKFKNDSPNNVFPGGDYKNYFQVLLPQSVIIKKITQNGTLVENYASQNLGNIKVVGFYFEVKAKTAAEINISYESSNNFQRGKGMYQLTMQKQLGATSDDLKIEVSLPKNLYLINQNFSPLVNNNQIVYNTNLSNDKIFLLELIKD